MSLPGVPHSVRARADAGARPGVPVRQQRALSAPAPHLQQGGGRGHPARRAPPGGRRAHRAETRAAATQGRH